MKTLTLFLAIFMFNFLFAQEVQNCLEFDGYNDYVEVSHDPSLNMGTDGITIEAWIKTSAVTPTGYWPVIVGKEIDGTRQGFNLFIAHHTNKIAFEVWINNQWYGVWGQVINDGKWHHVVGRRSGNRIYVFKDGVQSGGWVQTGCNGNVNCNYPLMIGRGSWGSGYFTGKIEEVRVWNRALTDEEINENMFKEISGQEAELKAYYRFNEDSGNILPDLTSYDNDGLLIDMNSDDWVASSAPIASTLTENLSDIKGIWSARTSSASSVMTISVPDISGDDRIIFGHNADSLTFNSTNVPSGIDNRLTRFWRIEKYGNLNGDVIFDCSGFGTRNENYRLLVDDDGDFSDAAITFGSYDSSVFNVPYHNFEHTNYYSLAISQDTPPQSDIILDSVGDSYIHSEYADTNYGTGNIIRVGSIYDPGASLGMKRGFVLFDLTCIPSGSVINRVVLRAYQTDGGIGQGFQVLLVSENWDEYSITWNNQSAVSDSIGIINMVSQGICTFENNDLLNLVQDWVNVAENNFGLSFRFHDENYNSANTSTLGDTFVSRENPNSSYIPPQLFIKYQCLTFPAPEVEISVENDNVILNWNAVPGATSYKVYSDTDPYGDFSTEEWTGTDTSWSEPVSGTKKFYYVKVVN